MKYMILNGKKQKVFTREEVAEKVHVSPGTLSVYLSQLTEKLGKKDGVRRYFSGDDILTLKATFHFRNA